MAGRNDAAMNVMGSRIYIEPEEKSYVIVTPNLGTVKQLISKLKGLTAIKEIYESKDSIWVETVNGLEKEAKEYVEKELNNHGIKFKIKVYKLNPIQP